MGRVIVCSRMRERRSVLMVFHVEEYLIDTAE